MHAPLWQQHCSLAHPLITATTCRCNYGVQACRAAVGGRHMRGSECPLSSVILGYSHGRDLTQGMQQPHAGEPAARTAPGWRAAAGGRPRATPAVAAAAPLPGRGSPRESSMRVARDLHAAWNSTITSAAHLLQNMAVCFAVRPNEPNCELSACSTGPAWTIKSSVLCCLAGLSRVISKHALLSASQGR